MRGIRSKCDASSSPVFICDTLPRSVPFNSLFDWWWIVSPRGLVIVSGINNIPVHSLPSDTHIEWKYPEGISLGLWVHLSIHGSTLSLTTFLLFLLLLLWHECLCGSHSQLARITVESSMCAKKSSSPIKLIASHFTGKLVQDTTAINSFDKIHLSNQLHNSLTLLFSRTG